MSIVTMNMSDYEIEQDGSKIEEYGDEVLCAGWNPSLALQQHTDTERSHTSAMPRELAAIDINIFLKKMYACQR